MAKRPPLAESLLEARQVLALNLKRLLRHRYPTATDLPREFEKEFASLGIKKSTVSRILDWNSDPYSYPGFDTLVRIAYALQRQIFELTSLGADAVESRTTDTLRRDHANVDRPTARRPTR